MLKKSLKQQGVNSLSSMTDTIDSLLDGIEYPITGLHFLFPDKTTDSPDRKKTSYTSVLLSFSNLYTVSMSLDCEQIPLYLITLTAALIASVRVTCCAYNVKEPTRMKSIICDTRFISFLSFPLLQLNTVKYACILNQAHLLNCFLLFLHSPMPV